MSKTRLRLAPLLIAASALCACEVGPNYHRPPAPTPQTYKEIAGWTLANPSDAADRADWWTMFGDPILNELEEKVAKSNFTLAADLAAYDEAHAVVAEQRAQLWPTLTGTGSASVSHNGSAAENAHGTAQSTYADLVNARLSAQMELAADYITLRQLDEEKRIDDDTVKAYQLSLDITRNKYNAGNAAESDVDTAESTLYSERATDTALAQQRGQMEHAIATLIGVPPDQLSITPTAWTLKPLDVPPGVPSALLQRRPDVAASERLAAAASANIGVAVSGYFPSVTLTGTGGTEAQQIGQLFSPQSMLWNAGASAAETIFNGGLTHAQVQASKAAYAEAVATYRATSLSAFQQVEDNLVAQRVLAAEQPDLLRAMNAADQALKITNNEYQAGTVDYTTVVTAEATALAAHNAELAVEASRLTTTVDLVVALGGGWNETELKSK